MAGSLGPARPSEAPGRCPKRPGQTGLRCATPRSEPPHRGTGQMTAEFARQEERMTAKLEYQDITLPIEKRADDLVSRMTLEEKVSQMVYDAPGIERLGVPKYNWWNECLHGVGQAGIATVFPQAIGLAATGPRSSCCVGGRNCSSAFTPSASRLCWCC